MPNEITKPAQKMTFSVAITTDSYKNMIARTIQDPRDQKRFVASITSYVANSPQLQDCTPASILACGFLANALGLVPSPQLGHFYMVPYNGKNGKQAQFQIGVNGLIQLAVRTGQYKHINAIAVKEGEVKVWNPLTEEIVFEPIEDFDEREKAKTIGYVAAFELNSGFSKMEYWSFEKTIGHADRYSNAFSKTKFYEMLDKKIPQSEMWKLSSPWYTSTDDMGCKTVLKRILKKYGFMSIEMQEAFDNDDKAAGFDTNGSVSFTDCDDVQEEAAPVAVEESEAVDISKL